MTDYTVLGMLRYMLMSPSGKSLFTFLESVDETLVDAVFTQFYKPVFFVLISYNKKYGYIPTKNMYNVYKKEVRAYTDMLDMYSSSDDNLSELKMAEAKLFEPLPEEELPYIKEWVEDYIIANHSSVLNDLQESLMSDINVSNREAFSTINRKREEFLEDLISALDGEDDGDNLVFVMNSEIRTKEINNAVVLRDPTFKETVKYAAKGYTSLTSSAKAYKTGTLISLAINQAMQGMHSLILDLENGMQDYLRRVYQSIMGLPPECIYLDRSVRKGLITNDLYSEYDRFVFYKPEDRVFIICTDTKRKSNKVGFSVDNYDFDVKVRYFKCVDPDYEPLSRSLQTLEFKGWEEMFEVNIKDEHLYGSFMEDGEKYMNKIGNDTGGQILIADAPNASANEIEKIVKKLVSSPFYKNEKYKAIQSEFFKNPETRMVNIDYILLMKNNKRGVADNVFMKADDNLTQLKEMRHKYNFSMLGIQAAGDNGKALSEWEVNPSKVTTRGSNKESLDTNHKIGLYATPNEQKLGLRRLATLYSRIAPHATEYYAIYPDTQRIKFLTPEEHKALNPEDWGMEEAESKGKDDFHDLNLGDLARQLGR